MLLILQDYNKYYKINKKSAESNDMRSHDFNFFKEYRNDDFVKSHSKNSQPFMSKFCECTHFINFVNRGIMSPNNPEIILIENALKQNNIYSNSGKL